MSTTAVTGGGLQVFETVLVADRGLLAVRVIRSCQRLGIKAVTCVVDGDEHALHARLADEAIWLATAADARSAQAVLEAARVSGAEAIHPGGGDRAVDVALARAVSAAGLAWVGPAPDALTESRPHHPGWRETVRRNGRTVLWEAAAADVRTDDGRALVGADRLVEALTGVDLVERQLRQAAGQRLDPLPPGSGYAIQAALYAGPQTLVPAAVRGWRAPQGDGIVVDAVLADGARLTPYDDAVLALVTAHGRDRAQALTRLADASDGMALVEPASELVALQALLREPSVVSMVG